jgi:phosphate transport system protein
MPLRHAFDQQLCGLRDEVQRLADMVAIAIDDSITALKRHDLALAQRVSDNDTPINQLRFQIEESAYNLLALQQPVGGDMRFIVATISVVTNLERIGDYAAGIARLILRMGEHGSPLPMKEFDEMNTLLKTMLTDSVRAYREENQPVAKAVIERDHEVDRLHRLIYETLITRMSHDSSLVESGTFSLWISHNLERMGDRTANIAHRVNYLVTGDLRTGNPID